MLSGTSNGGVVSWIDARGTRPAVTVETMRPSCSSNDIEDIMARAPVLTIAQEQIGRARGQ